MCWNLAKGLTVKLTQLINPKWFFKWNKYKQNSHRFKSKCRKIGGPLKSLEVEAGIGLFSFSIIKNNFLSKLMVNNFSGFIWMSISFLKTRYIMWTAVSIKNDRANTNLATARKKLSVYISYVFHFRSASYQDDSIRLLWDNQNLS